MLVELFYTDIIHFNKTHFDRYINIFKEDNLIVSILETKL